jgi:hypothetical protein
MDPGSGPATHDAQALPLVTFGSAGGFFKTGKYVDYRYTVPAARLAIGDYMGLPYRRWLGNVLMSMGEARADYETAGVGGYGDAQVAGGFASKIHTVSRGMSAGDPLPVITG